jgi:hypothetical protein
MEETLKRKVMRFGPLMALVFYAAGQLCASTIDSFSFTTPDSSPFTTNLTESFTSSGAALTGTVACDSTTVCSGEVGTFSLGLDLTNVSMLSITTDGSLTGDTSASGFQDLISPIEKTRAFNVPTGSFDYTRFTNEIPAWGMIDVTGSLNLTLQPGQVLTLPVTMGFASVVPEPSGQVLILVAALGLAGFVRYRYLQRAS